MLLTRLQISFTTSPSTEAQMWFYAAKAAWSLYCHNLALHISSHPFAGNQVNQVKWGEILVRELTATDFLREESLRKSFPLQHLFSWS